jgi:hypothetical protein
MMFWGKALYENGDYVASEKLLHEVTAYRAGANALPSAVAARDDAPIGAAHAMSLAALGRHAEARSLLARLPGDVQRLKDVQTTRDRIERMNSAQAPQ